MASHEARSVRREQILAAAQTCFGKTGYHKTTMDDIVHASGLSKGALYWHFQGKDEIFLALFDRLNVAIASSWEEPSDSSALETLRVESEVVLNTLLSDRDLVETWTEFLKHPLVRERFASIYALSRDRFQSTIEAAVQSGEITSCNAPHVAAMLIALVEGLLLQALADPTFDAMAAWPTCWETVSRGLSKGN